MSYSLYLRDKSDSFLRDLSIFFLYSRLGFTGSAGAVQGILFNIFGCELGSSHSSLLLAVFCTNDKGVILVIVYII